MKFFMTKDFPMRYLPTFFLCLALSLTLHAADPANFDRVVVFSSTQVVWEVDATQVVSVHRTRDEANASIVTVSVPLTAGRTHTQIVIADGILPYKDVLRFVQNLRFRPPEISTR
jgi:hypothetical protein